MEQGRAAAIVVAGGSGERFGRAGGKQLQPVAGWPVLSWSVRAIDATTDVAQLVIVCPQDQAEEYEKEAIAPLSLARRVSFAAAGATRQESVARGLALVSEEHEFVVVHDGARPLVSPELVTRCLDTLVERPEADGAVVGYPSVDTLKVVEGDVVVETPDRSRFWAVQTPQAFRSRALRRAHASAAAAGYLGTDDASLVERSGGRVVVVEGPRDNIKVTVSEDLAYVSAVLGKRRDGTG